MRGLATRKARPPKRAERPDTSPLVEIYAAWERDIQAALLGHWREKTHKLVLRLEMASKAVQDIYKDRDFWSDWEDEYKQLTLPHLNAGADVGADHGADVLQITWALGVDADVYNPTVTDWARKYAGELAHGLTKTDKTRLRQHLSAWVESHEDFPALVTRVDSFLNNQARARMVAATEATRCYAEGNLIAWRASEVVTGKIWETAMDEAVCPICGALHGQLSELDGQEWAHLRRPKLSVGLSVKAPPAHVNCRCWLAPWVDEVPAVEPVPAAEPVPMEKLGAFDDIAEAERWARESYPNIEWDFEGAHIDAINPTLAEFDFLARRYPQVAERLKYVGTYGDKGRVAAALGSSKYGFHGSHAFAHASRDGYRIGLNPKWYGKPDEFLDLLRTGTELRTRIGRKRPTRWSPLGCDTIESVFTHEFGHQVDNWLAQSHSQAFLKFVLKYVGMDGTGLVSDTHRMWKGANKARASLSVYATTNEAEGFAEGFSALRYMPENKHPKFVQRLGELLEAVGTGEKWIGSDEFGFVMDLPLDSPEREEAAAALRDLKRRLGIAR
jgi:SPP1 gp7 family putative phage head morphogenesis protein